MNDAEEKKESNPTQRNHPTFVKIMHRVKHCQYDCAIVLDLYCLYVGIVCIENCNLIFMTVNAFTHTHTRQGERENELLCVHFKKKSNLECLPTKIFICDVIRVRLTCDDRITTLLYRSIELIFANFIDRLNILIHKRTHTKNPFQSNRNTILSRWVCVSTFCPVSYKYRNILELFAVTSMVHEYETIWQLHGRNYVCVLSSETHANRQHTF